MFKGLLILLLSITFVNSVPYSHWLSTKVPHHEEVLITNDLLMTKFNEDPKMILQLDLFGAKIFGWRPYQRFLMSNDKLERAKNLKVERDRILDPFKQAACSFLNSGSNDPDSDVDFNVLGDVSKCIEETEKILGKITGNPSFQENVKEFIKVFDVNFYYLTTITKNKEQAESIGCLPVKTFQLHDPNDPGTVKNPVVRQLNPSEEPKKLKSSQFYESTLVSTDIGDVLYCKIISQPDPWTYIQEAKELATRPKTTEKKCQEDLIKAIRKADAVYWLTGSIKVVVGSQIGLIPFTINDFIDSWLENFVDYLSHHELKYAVRSMIAFSLINPNLNWQYYSSAGASLLESCKKDPSSNKIRTSFLLDPSIRDHAHELCTSFKDDVESGRINIKSILRAPKLSENEILSYANVDRSEYSKTFQVVNVNHDKQGTMTCEMTYLEFLSGLNLMEEVIDQYFKNYNIIKKVNCNNYV